MKLHFVAGKKRKDQHDANLAGMGLNPSYPGAYGATPAVSFSAVVIVLVNGHVRGILIC